MLRARNFEALIQSDSLCKVRLMCIVPKILKMAD